jgi:hypothetical protein
MPLAFPSRTHGIVAFGFFNIETDMLLFDDLFFFAEDFCRAVIRLCATRDATLRAWRIEEPRSIGDLHAAIAGQDLGGFIGATYALWPFPAAPEDFRQNPEGRENRRTVEELIADRGTGCTVSLERAPDWSSVRIGEVGFDRVGFLSLVAYLERGGAPRWRDDEVPGYIARMIEATDRLREA